MLQLFIYIFEFFLKFFHLRQGEACKDKIVPGKTPRSVSLFWIFGNFNCQLPAVLACVEFDSPQC